MRIGDESVLAATVRDTRTRRGLSQADLAEIARVSTKTIQRIEAARSVAPASRRAVLESLKIDPERLAIDPERDGDGPQLAADATHWREVADGIGLLKKLASVGDVEVELDRATWDAERRNQPWYRQGIFFATRDPIDIILEIVDGATAWRELPAGRRAKLEDELADAICAARKINWSIALRVDPSGRACIYLGAPSVAARRCAGGPERSAGAGQGTA